MPYYAVATTKGRLKQRLGFSPSYRVMFELALRSTGWPHRCTAKSSYHRELLKQAGLKIVKIKIARADKEGN